MAHANGTKHAPYRQAVATAASPQELAELLLAERKRLREATLQQPHGVRSCRANSDSTDLIIQRMLALALPEDLTLREASRSRIAIVATGGYGRRELCPYSDIDVTFIVAEEEDAALDATVRRMFLMLMEIFGQRVGLKVGYAYRTLADAAQLDHQTLTALLDTRVLAGSDALAERFVKEVFRQIWPAAFVRQKIGERAEVLEKHGGTLYRIEPEVREGPGGLRDLHLAEWLAAVSFPSTRGDVWRQLQRLGAVSRQDVQDVSAAREFLLTVRNLMHWDANRSADLLVRDRQERVAAALKFEDSDCASAVERFMEHYYLQIENVQRVTGFVIDRCLTERLSLTDELVCVSNELLPAFPWVRVNTPRFLVELGQHFQEYRLAPGHELRRMLAQHLNACPDLSADREAATDFVGLLCAPCPGPNQTSGLGAATGGAIGVPTRRPGVHETLQLLAQLGVLQRLIPELGTAYRRVPFDQVHRHTIGFHSLQTVLSLEKLRASTDEKLGELRRVWSEVQAPELLFLAGLLHDVGKIGSPIPGHAEAGAEMARAICARLGLDGPAANRVDTLVRHHLLMSETAQLRDLTLDKTILDFTQVIHSVDLLNMMILLTYADMEATGVLSPMKVRFLEDLYYRAEPVITGAAPSLDSSPERAKRLSRRLSRRLSASNLTPAQIEHYTEGMPVAYLLNTRPEEIALHIRMSEALQSNGPVVEFDQELNSEITTLHLCTLERPEPGLLSQISGVLYAHEISIHGAQVYTRTVDPPVALDTIWADFHGRPIPPLKRMELEQDLIATLKSGDVEGLIERCRKKLPAPILPHRVIIDNELADLHSVVEIEVEDQPGLLYRITRAMAALGWNIQSARISTRGDQARDAFYVTTIEGGKLDEEAQRVDAFLAEFAQ